jgi:glycerol-3-phosphate dehydrogenase (NAD+)
MCKTLEGKLKANVISISLIKGFYERPNGGIALISKLINDSLKCPVSALMGANLANEVAEEQFCETTIGCENEADGKVLKKLFNTESFLVTVVSDRFTVEICGALKNIVACAAGFAEGLGLGDNTKAAVIRLGLKEMVRFCKRFYPEGFKQETFFESCGVADLVTTCYGGRNRKCAVAFVKTGKSLEEIEKELLNGQKLQGPATAHEVFNLLEKENEVANFPLFEAVHLISSRRSRHLN